MNGLEDNEFLKGEVCEQYIVCSKPRCRCTDGQLHGPYYYRVWRQGERIQKQYVSKENLGAVRAACLAYKEAKDFLRAQNVRREQLSRELHRAYRKTGRISIPSCSAPPGKLYIEQS